MDNVNKFRLQTIVDELIKDEWAGPMIISKGRVWDSSTLPGFVAIDDEKFCGAATYRISDGECEIITLNSLKENQRRLGFD